MSDDLRDLIVVGGGPSGLAVAIAALRAGLAYEVVEKGVLVNSIYRFPHGMTFFTTPELLEIGDLPFVTPYAKPTREEALRYYRRVADTFALRSRPARGSESRREARRGFARREPGGAHGRVPLARPRHVRRRRPATTTSRTASASPARTCPTSSHYFDEPHPFHRRGRGRRREQLGGGAPPSRSTAPAPLVTLVHRRERLPARSSTG